MHAAPAALRPLVERAARLVGTTAEFDDLLKEIFGPKATHRTHGERTPAGRAKLRADRSRACYLHACLRYVEREPMTNATLRARLGISEPNKSIASRIIADAVRDGLIKPEDPNQGKKYARYLPCWA
jgi:predicted HTH transcriptional regulator